VLTDRAAGSTVGRGVGWTITAGHQGCSTNSNEIPDYFSFINLGAMRMFRPLSPVLPGAESSSGRAPVPGLWPLSRASYPNRSTGPWPAGRRNPAAADPAAGSKLANLGAPFA